MVICDKDRKEANKLIKKWLDVIVRDSERVGRKAKRSERMVTELGTLRGEIKTVRTIDDSLWAMERLTKRKRLKKVL